MNKLRYCIALLIVLAFSIGTSAQDGKNFGQHVQCALKQLKTNDLRGMRESLATCDKLYNALTDKEIEAYKRNANLNFYLSWYYYLTGEQAFESGLYQKAESDWMKCYNTLGMRQDHARLELYRNLHVNLGCLYFRLNNIPYSEKYLYTAKFGSEANQWYDLNYCNTLMLLGKIYTSRGEYLRTKMYLDESLHTLEDVFRKDLPEIYYELVALLSDCYWGMGYKEEAKQTILNAIEHLKASKASLRPLISLYSVLGSIQKYNGDYVSAKAIYQKAYDISRGDKSLSAYYKLRTSAELAIAQYLTSDTRYKMRAKRQSSVVIDDVIQQFSFLSAEERGRYWEDGLHYLSVFNTMLASSKDNRCHDQVYDNAIFAKGLLLRTTNRISEQLAKPENMGLRDIVGTLHDLQTKLITDSMSNSEQFAIKDSIRLIEKRLATDLIGYQSVDSIRSQYSFATVKRALASGEAAIEFIKLPEITTDSEGENYYYAAIIIKSDSPHPHIVRLCSESELLRLRQMPDALRKSGIRTYTQNELYRQYLYGSGEYQWRPSGRKPIRFTCVGDTLYDMIWKPIESHLRETSTIYYSTDGELNSLAFGAIPVNGAYLADKYTLSYLSSTAEIPTVKLASRKKPASASLYGGINYDTSTEEMRKCSRKYTNKFTRGEFENDTTNKVRGSWGFLLGSEREVTDIAAQLTSAGVGNRTFSESTANEESFKANSGNSPSLLHIATHGFFYPSEREDECLAFMRKIKGIDNVSQLRVAMNRTGILFSGANRAWRGESIDRDMDDGVLTADEISHLDLSNTDMVVLSACETGLGENVISEGVFGLQRAFKLAGVQTLVMSLWKVPDDETTEFMSLFYKNWLGGMDKHEAFQAAQREIKKATPNPYYWAGFVMMD